MKKLFLLFVLGLTIFSCNRDDEQTQEKEYPLVTKINIDFLSGYSPSPDYFYFEYDNQNRLIRRNGGFLQQSQATGYHGFFTDKIYTSLVYTDNLITIEDFSSDPQFIPLKNSKYITLNSKNQIEIKEIPDFINANLNKKQVFKYSNNRLTEILTTFPNMPHYPSPDDFILTYLEKFYYDSRGNLKKTEYIAQENGKNTEGKIIRTFENYDNSLNPFKRLYLLDNYFYFSLSKNNYRKYTETTYDISGTLISTVIKKFDFNYDSNGNIIIN